jgi:hypothetical protein
MKKWTFQSCLKKNCLVLFFVLFLFHTASSQFSDSITNHLTGSVDNLNYKSLKDLSSSYESINKNLDKQTQQVIEHSQKIEAKLQNKIQKIDSNKAKELFAYSKNRYEQFAQEIQNPPILNNDMVQKLKTYIPRVDSIQTVLKFLEQKSLNLSENRLSQLQGVSAEIQQLQGKLVVTTEVQNYLTERQQYLKQALAGLRVDKYVLGLNEQEYYYQQTVAQYKSMLSDKDKMQQFILSEVASQPAFQKFWQKNSILASIFPMPGNQDTSTAVGMAGLQTRKQIGSLIQEKLGKTTPGASASASNTSAEMYLQQKANQGNSELDNLKDKISQLGSAGGNSSMTLPDFQPNSQKTKTFLKRLEVGFDVQNTPSLNAFPATSNIAITLGYKANDKITFGGGVSYIMGWGAPVKNIHISNQGLGLRSFLNVKAKGSLWLTGGFETNYTKVYSYITNSSSFLQWQRSALLGLMKTYKIGSKTANVQLLYDFFTHQASSSPIPLVFRFGYTF